MRACARNDDVVARDRTDIPQEDKVGHRDGMREVAHGGQPGGKQVDVEIEEEAEEDGSCDEKDERPRPNDPEEEKRIAKLQR